MQGSPQMEEGELPFAIPTEFNGVKCAKIDKTYFLSEVEYWSMALICGVIGSNPPVEANKSIVKIVQVREGVFLVQFTNMQDKLEVIQRGVYFFNKKPFIVEAWNESLSLDTSWLQSLPLWVQFLKLDITYWGIESLSKLGSTLGILIKTDRTTKEKSAIKYAILLIEMSLDGPFPNHIDSIND
ncbi:hypothetical protein Cgig2_032393 [Carnegiea gigantea]|uniref:DUF4283 domain-containing protein n=1 Tax=Carnegiea gigantea TaxID=171969 RepID=A0A9Q1JIA6_9CARY|nr:hypothetical protein Cgig2_032393 [Carnegiea gigantea]